MGPYKWFSLQSNTKWDGLGTYNFPFMNCFWANIGLWTFSIWRHSTTITSFYGDYTLHLILHLLIKQTIISTKLSEGQELWHYRKSAIISVLALVAEDAKTTG